MSTKNTKCTSVQVGKRSVRLDKPAYILQSASVVGTKE